jgi:hypothetical protein
LDKRLAGSAIAGAVYASITVHAAALERRGRQTQVARDLSPVVEGSVEHFSRQD